MWHWRRSIAARGTFLKQNQEPFSHGTKARVCYTGTHLFDILVQLSSGGRTTDPDLYVMYSKHVCVCSCINELFQSGLLHCTSVILFRKYGWASLWLSGLVAMVTWDTTLALNQSTICPEQKRPHFLHTLRNHVSFLFYKPKYFVLLPPQLLNFGG